MRGGLCLLLLLGADRVAAAGCHPGYWFSYENLQPSPPLTGALSLTYDKARHQTVGFYVEYTNNQTWVYNGTSWLQKFPTHSPSKEYPVQLSFDELRNIVVLISPSRTTLSDEIAVWEWDGTDWQDIPPEGDWPSRRFDFKVVYDSRRGKHVLFGGLFYVQTEREFTQETWEYDGVTRRWERASTIGPSPRRPGGMAFDRARGVTVMAGGLDDYGLRDDTWTWNGSSWSLQPARLPYGGVLAVSMVYDEFNRVVWTFDGELGVGAYNPAVFAWDGIDYQCGNGRWVDRLCTSRIDGSTPNNRFLFDGSAPAAYDSDRLRVVAVSSWDGENTGTFLLARGNLQPINFVDWRNPTPPGDGTARNPFNAVQDAIPCVTDGSTLFIQSGTYQAGPIKIGRRVDVIPLGGSVTIR